MSIVDEIMDKFNDKFVGVNPRAIDRLHKGKEGELLFFVTLSKERAEAETGMIKIGTEMNELRDELADLRESVKDSGILSMGMGEKRDPAKDQQ